MAGARIGLRANRAAQAFLLAGILVAANLVGQRWFLRADLTEHRQYTVAPSTRKALEGLDDVVRVNAYFSRRLPPYLANLRRQVQDVLEEYRAYSRGKLALEFVDPGDDVVSQQRMRALGIPQVQLEVLERDQFQLSNVYLGLALLYGGRQEVIPVIQDSTGLEYELTAAILRLTSPQKKAVAWLSGRREGGEEQPRGRGNPLRQELEKLYDLQELRPEGLDRIPDGAQTLVVEGPRGYAEPARYAVDQFIMRGGRAIFLVDHLDLPEGTLFPTPVESGVHDLLAHYGVKVQKDVVAEPRLNAPAAFSSGIMQFRIPYPYWVRTGRGGLDREHPVTSRLESVVFPWASSLKAEPPAGVKAVELARSSPESLAETGSWDFTPQPGRDRPARREGAAEARPLAILLTGRFPSFWKGKPAPAGPGAAFVAESPETSVLVVGTSHLSRWEFLRQFPEDGVLLLNAVDWMTMGPELIGIRSRAADERPLPPVSDRAKSALKAVNVVFVPALLAVVGLARLTARRRRGSAS